MITPPVERCPTFPPATRRRPARWAVPALATALLSAVFVLAPMPQLVSARDLQVRTEHVALGPRAAPRSGQAIAAANLAGDDGPALRAALDSSGRRGSGVVSARYAALGVGLPAVPDAPILVRGRVAGAWTPWLELAFSPGEAPDLGTVDPSSGVHSEPVWMGDADAYELDAPATVTQIDVHLVADGPVRRSIEVAPASAGASAAPAVQPRSAWGARPPRSQPVKTADLKGAVVHHSANANTYSAAQVPELLRSIQAYHQDVQGWDDIAYNFAVDRFGQIWEAHDGGITNVVVGGHSQGFNVGTVGVVVLGDFATATVPSAAIESVAQLIAWKLALHRVDPASTVPFTSGGSAKYPTGTTVTLPRIVGHRDVQATDCPGNLLYSSLAAIRARVAQLVPAYQQALAPLLLAPDDDGNGRIDPVEYHPGATGDVRWHATTDGQLTRSPASVSGAYRPAVGDFDGDGRRDVLWHGTGSTPDPLWWASTTGFSTQYVTVNGSYAPVVGDFDGNGVDDVFWYAAGLAPDSVWYFRADRSLVSVAAPQDLITGVPLVGDFDGDGRDDIFFYGPGTADDSLWRGTVSGWAISAQSVSGWYDPVAMEATGDGVDDILWFAPGATASYRWAFDTSATHTSTTLTTSALVGRPRVGDFDGDGLEDVLLVASGPDRDEVWYSTATGIDSRAVSVNLTYEVVVGPLDTQPGSTTDDVLFVSASGADYLWLGSPTRTFSSTLAG